MQGIRLTAALAVTVSLGGCFAQAMDQVSRLSSISFEAPPRATPPGYEQLFSPAAHNIGLGRADLGDPVRSGAHSERYELRDGDCDGSDCSAPRARAEIEMTDAINTARIGQDFSYSYSFYNASVPAFTKENALRLVFGQWTVGGKHRPLFRFIQLGTDEGNFATCEPSVCVGPNTTRGDLVVQLDNIAQARGWGKAQNNGYICRLFDMTARRGEWVDLTVNTNFSASGDGYLRIWVDDALVCDYAGPLISREIARAGTPLKHRRGIFSSWDKRWQRSMGDTPKPTLIVYYDDFRIGAEQRVKKTPAVISAYVPSSTDTAQ